jgi:hypothetical protein
MVRLVKDDELIGQSQFVSLTDTMHNKYQVVRHPSCNFLIDGGPVGPPSWMDTRTWPIGVVGETDAVATRRQVSTSLPNGSPTS